MHTIFSRIALAIAFVCCCSIVSAVDSPYYHVMLESDDDRTSNEVYQASYVSLQDFLDNVLHSSSNYSQLDISSAFSAGGITYDGLQYHVLLESDDDRTENEVYLASYDSLQDFLDNILSSSSGYSLLNISSAFSVGGFTFDGLQYHVLLESDDDRADNEVYLASYDSLQDFFDNILSSSSGYSQLNISTAFSAGGFDFDGSQFHVLLESNDDRTDNEVFLASYDSLPDFFDNILSSSSSYSQLNISSAFSAGGFFSERKVSFPDSVTMTRGDYVSGDEASLAESDNVDFVIRRSGTDTRARTEFEVLGTSRTAIPPSFEVTLEGSVFARSTVIQTIELWDYVAGDWELVDTRNATNQVDSTATVAATGDLSRFVDQTTFLVEAAHSFPVDQSETKIFVEYRSIHLDDRAVRTTARFLFRGPG